MKPAGARLIFDGRAGPGCRWPHLLRPGDTVGICAPAHHFNRQELRRGVAVLEGWGLRVRIPEEIFRRKRYLAGDDDNRFAVIKELMEDDSVAGLMAARGGFGCQRLLPSLEHFWPHWPAKPIIGFSDLTALHLARLKASGIIGYHAPMVVSLGKASPLVAADADSQADLRGALFSAPSPTTWNFSASNILKRGQASGPAMGGNLTLVTALLSGPWWPGLDGAVLFLEEVEEQPYRLDRLLTTVRQSSLWHQAKALVFGQFTRCGPPAEVKRLLREAAEDFSGPVLINAPFGHESRNRFLPLGAWVELEA